MKPIVLLVVAGAAVGLLLVRGSGERKPRAVQLVAGERYRFVGFVKPPLSDSVRDAFLAGLEAQGGSAITLSNRSDRTLVTYEMAPQASMPVTINQPMGFGFLPGEFVVTEVRRL